MFIRLLFISLLVLTSVSANAHDDGLSYPGGSKSRKKCMDIADPYEKLNRKIFMLNSVLDHFLLKPVAKGYRNAVNEEFRGKVSNAVDNSVVPLTTLNKVLQREPEGALLSFWQFMVNSTFGIGGLENVAKKRGLQVKPQTFGSTLAKYGVGPGPYIVLPIFGGTSTRDVLDPLVLNKGMNPVNYVISTNAEYAITGVKLVSDRSDIMPFTDHVTATSTDPYVTIRSAMHQNREKDLEYPSYYRCR